MSNHLFSQRRNTISPQRLFLICLDDVSKVQQCAFFSETFGYCNAFIFVPNEIKGAFSVIFLAIDVMHGDGYTTRKSDHPWAISQQCC